MREIRTGLLILLISFMLSTVPVVYAANDALSLDEIVAREREAIAEQYTANNMGEAVGNKSVREKEIRESANQMMEKLGDAAIMDINDPKADRAGAALKNIVGSIIALLGYVITLGLVLRVMMDLTYIGLPFSRKLLGNGYVGNARAGDASASGGMGGMGGMGGIGGMGSMGGMGGRFGGFGGGYGSYGGMGRFGGGYGGPMNSPGMSQDQMGAMTGRLQLVSNAALNAAISETSVDVDGKNMNPFKIYFKDMVVVLVITPILLVLSVSGVLYHVGLMAGSGVANIISGIGSMF